MDLKIELLKKEPHKKASQENTLKKSFPRKDLKKKLPKEGSKIELLKKEPQKKLSIKGPQN
ncbi:hypothetical protein BpHYR1_014570 [Brachionus plicatilis]|uniref:Uncharacterized protein n=1 Tax=Brachionus plicatilis TaxID=10195 RepID=A0A3M7RST2_BRAPC|nr:hypothetical protein BpHYR1_014570 [Brachionus plicatilis]